MHSSPQAEPVTVSAAMVGPAASAPEPAASAPEPAVPVPEPAVVGLEAAACASPTVPKKRISVEEISPVPSAKLAQTGRRRKCKRSEIVTSSPMKLILESKASKQKEAAKKVVENKAPESSCKTKRKISVGDKEMTKRKKTSQTGWQLHWLHFCFVVA